MDECLLLDTHPEPAVRYARGESARELIGDDNRNATGGHGGVQSRAHLVVARRHQAEARARELHTRRTVDLLLLGGRVARQAVACRRSHVAHARVVGRGVHQLAHRVTDRLARLAAHVQRAGKHEQPGPPPSVHAADADALAIAGAAAAAAAAAAYRSCGYNGRGKGNIVAEGPLLLSSAARTSAACRGRSCQ